MIFHLKKFFLMNFHEVYENFWKTFLFFWVILIFHFKKFLFINVHEVYEYFWKIFLFLSHILHGAAYIRWSLENILRPRTERVNYLDYLDCLKVMNFLVNVCIFPLSKKRELTPQTQAFLLFPSSSWFFP